MPWTEQNRTEWQRHKSTHTLTQTIFLVGCRECHSAELKCVDLFHLGLLYPCVRWVKTKAKTCLQIFISIFFSYILWFSLAFFHHILQHQSSILFLVCSNSKSWSASVRCRIQQSWTITNEYGITLDNSENRYREYVIIKTQNDGKCMVTAARIRTYLYGFFSCSHQTILYFSIVVNFL